MYQERELFNQIIFGCDENASMKVDDAHDAP